MATANLTRFAWLSIGAAILTIALKSTAYWLTGSVGLLSDALESLVNLVAAIMALAMLTIAARPADEMHAFGYGKVEYFSSGLEGALILLAAASIAWTAVPRLFAPQPLENVGIGLGISVLASAINFGVARVLMNAGKEHRSITLEADAHHLMTDVWTSAGVVLGVGAVALTGWVRLDPIIALVVAANILRIGWQLLGRSVRGLMDATLPAAERDAIKRVLNRYESQGIQYHALRTRQAGTRAFISLHVLVPREWTVKRGHDLLEQLERDIRSAVPGAQLFTHLEPQGDPAALEDIGLDRKDNTAGSENN
ncbi:MAG TPA: cation diffusion facilitator family transporter [Candidatus Binatia bacterium]|nr:cation diffusion facilitator family transporter [Candidatus Binatia bacterium]